MHHRAGLVLLACQSSLVSLLADCGTEGSLLVGDEDLESIDHLCKRDASVLLPALYNIFALNENNEVLIGALVVDFGNLRLSCRHDSCSEVFMYG